MELEAELEELQHEELGVMANVYGKVPKFSDARYLCCNHPKILRKLAVSKKCSEDPDQTAPCSSLIWVCTVCPDLSVRKLAVITNLIFA